MDVIGAKYTTLVEDLKYILKKNELEYFGNPRKENVAINNFLVDGYEAPYVLELALKLIVIKRHKDYRNEPFWVSATYTISGLYSYQVQIENIYAVICGSTTLTNRGSIHGRSLSSAASNKAHTEVTSTTHQPDGEEDIWIQHCVDALAQGNEIRGFEKLPKKLQTEKVRKFYGSISKGENK